MNNLYFLPAESHSTAFDSILPMQKSVRKLVQNGAKLVQQRDLQINLLFDNTAMYWIRIIYLISIE